MSLSLTGIFRKKAAEAFTPDGWFRTGDLGFFDQEGYLHLTGRLSTLIVTESGEKVQPEDVEEAYREAEVISEIGVLQQDGKLVAVIVPKLSQIHAGKEEAIGQAIREAVQRVSPCLRTQPQSKSGTYLPNAMPLSGLVPAPAHSLTWASIRWSG